MIGFLLTFLDLLSFIGLTLFHFNLGAPFQLMIMGSVYLIGKAIMFRDGMSIVDGVCGFYILITWLLGVTTWIYWIILVWFANKIISQFMFSQME